MPIATVANGSVELHCVVEGDGASVVLLHGWPDTSELWRGVAPLLRDAGFRVVAPDLRGTGRSSKPEGKDNYAVTRLLGDVAAVVDQLCGGRAHVVGHDWGSSLAWAFASLFPDKVDRLVALSVGHPTSFRSGGIAQQVRSWYVLLFEHEEIAEAWLLQDDAAAFREWLGHPDPEGVLRSFVEHGSLTTHLNWYRANITASSFVAPPPSIPAIQAPTLGIWSSRDFALTEGQMTGSAEFCAGGFDYVRLEGRGHWFPLEDPVATSSLIASFLSGER